MSTDPGKTTENQTPMHVENDDDPEDQTKSLLQTIKDGDSNRDDDPGLPETEDIGFLPKRPASHPTLMCISNPSSLRHPDPRIDENSIDPDQNNLIDVDLPCYGGNEEGIELKPMMNSDDLRDKLHKAAEENDAKSLRQLLKLIQASGTKLEDEQMLGQKYKETALHAAVIKNNKRCGKLLVAFGGPDLVKKEYTSQEYDGVTALHLAVVKESEYFIDLLMGVLDGNEKHMMLHKKGHGTDFEEKYQCPWIALHLAAAEGNIELFDKLLSHDADLWKCDPDTGNSVLHSLAQVAAAEPEECVTTFKRILKSDEVKKWWQRKQTCLVDCPASSLKPQTMHEALLKYENHDGLTPFLYASCMGATDLAKAILEVEQIYTFPQWELGPSIYTLYEVSEIDSDFSAPVFEIPDMPEKDSINKPHKPSALEIYSFGLADEFLDYGELDAIKWTMLNKWETYKRWFLGWFIFHFAVMTGFTLSLQFRHISYFQETTNTSENWSNAETNSSDTKPDSVRGALIHTVELFVYLVALLYLFLEIRDVIVLIKKRYWTIKSCKGTPQKKLPLYLTFQFDIYRVILFVFAIFVFMLLILRLLDSAWQDLAYAVAALFGWSFMLFFTQAFKNVGIFMVMMRQMIRHELAYFSIVFSVILISFGTASYCLFQFSPGGHPEQVTSIPMTLFSLFRLLVGLDEFAISAEATLPWLMKIFFALFVLLSNILLLNMLIAAMSNTFTQMEEQKELMWLKMRTQAVLMIERRLPRKLRPDNNLHLSGDGRHWYLGAEQMRKWNPMVHKRRWWKRRNRRAARNENGTNNQPTPHDNET